MPAKSPNKVAHFREAVQNAVEAADFPPDFRAEFVDRAVAVFATLDDRIVVYDSFYNFETSVARIAAKSATTVAQVRQNPLSYLPQFFSIHHLLRQDKQRLPSKARQGDRLKEVLAALETDAGRQSLRDKAQTKPLPAVAKPENPDVTPDSIEDSARVEVVATGRRPVATALKIKYGKLANGRRTWMSVNSALVFQTGALRGCGFTSLSDFLDAKGIFSHTALEQAKARGVTFSATAPTPAQRILRDAIRIIFRHAAVPFGSHNALTVVSEGKTVSDLNKAFRQSTVGGWEDLMPGPAPKHFTGFMLGTGVAVKDNGQIVPAPKERLEAIAAMLKLP